MDFQLPLLKKIKRIVQEQVPDAQVYLFGSRARGNSLSDSDWDILILLKKEYVSSETEETITSPLYDLELETGAVISPMIYSEEEWNHKHRITPFYKNVMREGIKL